MIEYDLKSLKISIICA